MTADNLFNCELTEFQCPPPERMDSYSVISYWSAGGYWCDPKKWFATTEDAEREAQIRANTGHQYIFIVRLPGNGERTIKESA